MSRFTVSVTVNDRVYTFDASTIHRNITDGAGNPLFYVRAYCDDGTQAILNLAPDWTIKSLYRLD